MNTKLTVAELIEFLQQFPKTMEVQIWDKEFECSNHTALDECVQEDSMVILGKY